MVEIYEIIQKNSRFRELILPLIARNVQKEISCIEKFFRLKKEEKIL